MTSEVRKVNLTIKRNRHLNSSREMLMKIVVVNSSVKKYTYKFIWLVNNMFYSKLLNDVAFGMFWEPRGQPMTNIVLSPAPL